MEINRGQLDMPEYGGERPAELERQAPRGSRAPAYSA